MSVLPEPTLIAAAIAVEDSLRESLGFGLDAETSSGVVVAVLEKLSDEGLILVRRDDLDAYLNQRPGNVRRAVEALNRLQEALDDKEKPHV